MCPKASTSKSSLGTKNKILLLSGLGLANDADSLSHELLIEWINGMAGTSSAQKKQSHISQVIIAGK